MESFEVRAAVRVGSNADRASWSRAGGEEAPDPQRPRSPCVRDPPGGSRWRREAGCPWAGDAGGYRRLIRNGRRDAVAGGGGEEGGVAGVSGCALTPRFGGDPHDRRAVPPRFLRMSSLSRFDEMRILRAASAWLIPRGLRNSSGSITPKRLEPVARRNAQVIQSGRGMGGPATLGRADLRRDPDRSESCRPRRSRGVERSSAEALA
jgi:hypothetical protein